jgi:hypothetical protein
MINTEMTWRMVNMTVDQIEAFFQMQTAANETHIQTFQATLWANSIQYDMEMSTR